MRQDLELVAPHRMFTLPLNTVAEKGLGGAQPAGWRFLIADKERVLACAEIADDGKSPSVNSGPYVESTAAAIDHIEQLPEISDGAYEMRILKVPALYIVAAWLVNEYGVIVPLAPTPDYLEAGKPYPEEEFLTVLREPADAILAQDDGFSGG